MKIIAFIRFIIAAYMVYKLAANTIEFLTAWDTLELSINIGMQLLSAIFVYYSIRQGLYEFGGIGKNSPRLLRIYAIVFEIIMVLGIAWVVITWEAFVITSVILTVAVLAAFIALVTVDIKSLKALR